MSQFQVPPPQHVRIASGGAAHLSIDLRAVQANWAVFQEKIGADCLCAGVVKADAYGLGAEQVGAALYAAGARVFFVAVPEEGMKLRKSIGDGEIYVLNGLFNSRAELYQRYDLKPVLSSLEEVEEWSAFARHENAELPAALHFDTGMHRLGLSEQDAHYLAKTPDELSGIHVDLVMSHLACADGPDHKLNTQQLAVFRGISELFPGVRRSLANSAGVLLGAEYHLDLVRPGIGLYGGNPLLDGDSFFQPVAHVYGEVMSLRDVPAGDTVGYGATRTAQRASRIAIINVGYADGYNRLFSSSDERPSAGFVMIEGYKAPLFGRISMDMSAVDVTDVPAHLLKRGTLVEVMGAQVSVDELAKLAQTIPYELLCNLGTRYTRHYLSADHTNLKRVG